MFQVIRLQIEHVFLVSAKILQNLTNICINYSVVPDVTFSTMLWYGRELGADILRDDGWQLLAMIFNLFLAA